MALEAYDEKTAQMVIDFYTAKGFNKIAIISLLANLYAESKCRPNNLQNGYEKKWNTTDEEYTRRVDANMWLDPINFQPFRKDHSGYGIVQWTSEGRKGGFEDYAHFKKVSIADALMQIEYSYIELTSKSFKEAYEGMLNATSLRDCTILIMRKYEKPASKDDPDAQNKRVEYAEELYKKYYGGAKMSNSPLVNKTLISPNRTHPRKDVIDTVTVHCYVGQVTVDRALNGFYTNGKNSCNYVIGFDGQIGLCVPEEDRSWCSSTGNAKGSNDHRAITIEVASDTVHPYKVTDAAFESLIKLLADICKRNNIKQLLWKGDKSLIGQVDKQNMTVHRWFAAKACPGDYLYERHSLIAERVNQLLGVVPKNPTDDTMFMYHTVRKGEYLGKIANLYSVPLDAIIKENPKYKANPSLIHVGDVITIPVVETNVPKTYTVVAGDYLSKVGKKTGIDWRKIAQINGIKAPYIIHKGQVLKLK